MDQLAEQPTPANHRPGARNLVTAVSVVAVCQLIEAGFSQSIAPFPAREPYELGHYAAFGLALSHAFLGAAWAVFSPQSIVVRYLAAPAWVGVSWLVFSGGIILNTVKGWERWSVALSGVGAILFGCFVIGVIWLVALKVVLGIRVDRGLQTASPRQFQLLELLFWMAAACVLAWIVQFVVERTAHELQWRLLRIFIAAGLLDLVLLPLGIVLTLHRGFAQKFVDRAMLFLLAISFWGALLCLMLPPSLFLIAVNAAVFSVSIFFSLLVLRGCGYQCSLAILPSAQASD